MRLNCAEALTGQFKFFAGAFQFQFDAPKAMFELD